jgi:hypothetical protein
MDASETASNDGIHLLMLFLLLLQPGKVPAAGVKMSATVYSNSYSSLSVYWSRPYDTNPPSCITDYFVEVWAVSQRPNAHKFHPPLKGSEIGSPLPQLLPASCSTAKQMQWLTTSTPDDNPILKICLQQLFVASFDDSEYWYFALDTRNSSQSMHVCAQVPWQNALVPDNPSCSHQTMRLRHHVMQ